MLASTLDLDKIAFKKIEGNPDKSTIIFLHDSLGSIELWRDFPDKLAQLTGHPVLIYDRQGYGKSCDFSYDKRDNDYMELEADILIQLCEKWNIEKPILFGHSDGGSIALIAAGKYPEKISALIVEGAHIFVEDVTIAGISQAAKDYETTILKEKLEKYHGDKTDKMFKMWTETWLSAPFKTWNIEKFLSKIKIPTLVIQGEKDQFGTLNQVMGIMNQVGGYPKAYVPKDAYHTPHKEMPELILQKTSDFINAL